MLKLTLLALLAASASSAVTDGTTPSSGLALAAGETKCACRKPGGSGKCNLGTAPDGLWEKCSWLQSCAVASNTSYSMCIKKGNQACYRHVLLGSAGSIVAAKEQPPYKTCCEEFACNSTEMCVPKEGGTGTFEYQYALTDGSVTTLQKWTLADIARNGWRWKDGTGFANKPRVCVPKIFDVAQGMKQIAAPLFACFFVFLSIILVCLKRTVSCCEAAVPMIVLSMSFFLSITEGWAFALFTALVAVATMVTPEDKLGRLVLFQLSFAWLYYGGTNFFYQIGLKPMHNYFQLAATKTLKQMETECRTYYDGFYDLTKWKPWSVDPELKGEILCDRPSITFFILAAYCQALMLFLMVALTLINYLSPGITVCGGCKGKPVQRAEVKMETQVQVNEGGWNPSSSSS